MLEMMAPSTKEVVWRTIHMEGLPNGVTVFSDGQGNVCVTFNTYPSGEGHRLNFSQREATVANINAQLKAFNIRPHI
ncbi:MAG TPA: hypothetical protein DCX25_03330 [Candidatus Pacebacteria bacterium]|nr:MAG: hypothetical protein UX00_C0001G0033 [Microgenomates group bacterium GW2011_GWB1_45_17]KKU24225.1 MAG: hypothetical protein UX36_C0002G0208 [Microgenomates group bacterium GW2011_GWC1_46_15]KKU24941.1 MAG: hypothetical protein UX35_C0001G0123 [Microgenomates group bacterium GW2011_GWA1_46_15]HAV15337.1 hypothetical protein [Candidatus Paceibacterota bacterium]HCR11391.1 hypothetical protein [Candidatus Paceibacterota bacterium]